jgi:ATP-dependent RNA helicase DBP3
MSKRKYEDETTVSVTTPRSLAAKKAKKDDGGEKVKKTKEERKTSKEAKQYRKSGVKAEDRDSAGDVEDAEKRKHNAEKKAEKLAKKLAVLNAPAEETAEEILLRKAARKAAKKAAKEAKKIKPSKDDRTASATPANGTSETNLVQVAAGSKVPQKAASSTTSSAPATLTLAKSIKPDSTADSLAFLKGNQITIDEDPSITSASLSPITSFSQLPLTNDAERTPFAKFKAPTPIQAAAWPYLLAGRDVIGVAETGSGKTWAFGVPCIRYIKELPKDKRRGVKAVIVSPTRELALQIQEQIEKLAGPAKLHVACLYGGVDKTEQRAALKKASIIVATPGRLNDLVEEGAADLSNAQYVVLDEADRMLDKGFEDAVRQIISATSQDRQTLMFTATWPPSVRQLAATFMKTPVKIIIGDNPTGELRANTRIQQLVEVIAPDAKNSRLIQLLRQYQSGPKKNDRILIFCLYKKEAQRVHLFLQGKSFKVAGIHGDMSQVQRIKSLEEFKSGKCTQLVATDVAARGLDIPAVKVVINVTFPLTAEDYVHRIGRTGRAGQDGIAVTLFTEHDKSNSGA